MADSENKKPDKPDSPKPDSPKSHPVRHPADNFVAKLVPDPANPPDVIRLTGYPGASSQEGHIRLYANPELTTYWDIPEADVLYEKPVSPTVDALGAVTLWIKRDSAIVSHAGKQGGDQAMYTYTFFDPTQGAAPQAAGAAFGGGGTGFPTFPTVFSVTPQCHSVFQYCPPPSPFYPYCIPSPPHFLCTIPSPPHFGCTIPSPPHTVCTIPSPPQGLCTVHSPVVAGCTVVHTPFPQCATLASAPQICPVVSPNCTQIPTTPQTPQTTPVGTGASAAP